MKCRMHEQDGAANFTNSILENKFPATYRARGE